MFFKRNRRRKNGETYEYWNLVRTVRTARGPRHEVVASLGKAHGLDSRTRREWEDIADLLDGHQKVERSTQMKLGETACAPKSSQSPQWAQVDVSAIRVERVRDFGGVFLALALWRRLGLHTLLDRLIKSGKETNIGVVVTPEGLPILYADFEVKLLSHPDGKEDERYVMCRSRERAQKEAAMLENKITNQLDRN